ncbi:hypothetical protein GGR22_001178 [Flavobacterium gossypii]|uniref:Uncharacterized protein n=1 Tax=Flavobacterium gossypii TaxID=1646119 RepID=A0ABR6DMY8_9FLAO|nr:hypothetical protein [Flavobacterium gossypii]MBA9073052.1 hypothetical protein [Flavobacterium gossypii]
MAFRTPSAGFRGPCAGDGTPFTALFASKKHQLYPSAQSVALFWAAIDKNTHPTEAESRKGLR